MLFALSVAPWPCSVRGKESNRRLKTSEINIRPQVCAAASKHIRQWQLQVSNVFRVLLNATCTQTQTHAHTVYEPNKKIGTLLEKSHVQSLIGFILMIEKNSGIWQVLVERASSMLSSRSAETLVRYHATLLIRITCIH